MLVFKDWRGAYACFFVNLADSCFVRHFILLDMPSRRQPLAQTFVVNQQHLSTIFIDRIASRCKVLFMVFRGLEDGFHGVPTLFRRRVCACYLWLCSFNYINAELSFTQRLTLMYAYIISTSSLQFLILQLQHHICLLG